MERLTLTCKGFYDEDVLNKTREIVGLKNKILEIEKKYKPPVIIIKNPSDYKSKINDLFNSIENCLIEQPLITWQGVIYESEIPLEMVLSCELFKLTGNSYWSENASKNIIRNISSTINAMTSLNGWIEMIDENIDFILDTTISIIEKCLWDEKCTGILDNWKNGVCFKINCPCCKKIDLWSPRGAIVGIDDKYCDYCEINYM